MVPRLVLASMVRHALCDLDHEVCGVLIGRPGEGSLRLDRVLRGRNRASAPANRFELHPADVVLSEQLARETGLEVLGFYHSHPRGEARPSALDRDSGWPGTVQVILAPGTGQSWHMKAWIALSTGWRPIESSRSGQKIF